MKEEKEGKKKGKEHYILEVIILEEPHPDIPHHTLQKKDIGGQEQ